MGIHRIARIQLNLGRHYNGGMPTYSKLTLHENYKFNHTLCLGIKVANSPLTVQEMTIC